MQEFEQSVRDQGLGRRLLTSFIAAEFLLITGNLIVRICSREALLPGWAIALIAIGTAVPMLLFAAQFFRMLRGELDEMLQRIVLEGLALATVVFVALAGLFVNARAAGLVSMSLDPPELLLTPPILVALAVLIAWSRHK